MMPNSNQFPRNHYKISMKIKRRARKFHFFWCISYAAYDILATEREEVCCVGWAKIKETYKFDQLNIQVIFWKWFAHAYERHRSLFKNTWNFQIQKTHIVLSVIRNPRTTSWSPAIGHSIYEQRRIILGKNK